MRNAVNPIVGKVSQYNTQYNIKLEECDKTVAPTRGDISAMYMGPTTDEAPTAKPPAKRKNKKEYQSMMAALPTAETK